MSVYHNRFRDGDLDLAYIEMLAGHLEDQRSPDGIGFAVNTTHFGAMAVQGDSAIVLNGSLVGEKPKRPQILVGNRRTDSIALHRKGRNGRQGGRWHRILNAVRDTSDVLGELDMSGSASWTTFGTVLSPNEVLGELIMLADATQVAAAGVISPVQPGEFVMQGTAVLTAAGAQVHAGQLRMVGDADIRMRGTGGNNASVDPTQRRGGIVAIGIRGGHS